VAEALESVTLSQWLKVVVTVVSGQNEGVRLVDMPPVTSTVHCKMVKDDKISV